MEKIKKEKLSELFTQIKENNTSAFEKLYHMCSKLVYSIAFSIVKNKQDAEEIVQVVFTKIYTIEKSKLPSKSEASWLYAITKNEAINFWKKRNNHLRLEDIYEIEDKNSEINKIIEKDSYHNLISGLNQKEKEIISLKILADLSFEEIAKMLKIPTGTVKWKYYKAVHTLKILLSNLGMFIVTVTLGMITLKNRKKIASQTEAETNSIKNEIMREENEDQTSIEETKKEDESILEDNASETLENTIQIPEANHEPNYIGIGFMGISSIFFILTIIFSIIFTKHQLKARKRLSK